MKYTQRYFADLYLPVYQLVNFIKVPFYELISLKSSCCKSGKHH